MESSMDVYMERISKEQRTSAEEERELAKQIHGNDPVRRRQALDRLVAANLRLVVKIAHDFKNLGLEFEDLVSEGNIGLMTAAEKFDPDKCPRFSPYAGWWVKQAMRKALNRQSRTIYIPDDAFVRLCKIRSARNALAAKLGRMPSEYEIAEHTGIAEETVHYINTAATDVHSMSDTIDKDPDAPTFGDLLAEAPNPEGSPAKEALLDALEHLSDAERLYIEGIYGLKGEPQTSRELAQRIGIPINKVTSFGEAILRKLQQLIVEFLAFDSDEVQPLVG